MIERDRGTQRVKDREDNADKGKNKFTKLTYSTEENKY